MSASTYDAAGQTDAGTEVRTVAQVPERRVITEKTVAELDLLHQEVLATRPAKPWRSIASRRAHREARVAESDLLRALGFADWETFDARVGPRSVGATELEAEPHVDLVAAEASELGVVSEQPHHDQSGPDLVDIADLVGLVLQQLADTRADLQALQASSARVDELLDRALMEIVALRLELVVMATRTREQLS